VTVVGDNDGIESSSLALDVDLGSISIQTIFNQFLHDADGTLDYFARGDAIDYFLGEGADLLGSSPRWLRCC